MTSRSFVKSLLLLLLLSCLQWWTSCRVAAAATTTAKCDIDAEGNCLDRSCEDKQPDCEKWALQGRIRYDTIRYVTIQSALTLSPRYILAYSPVIMFSIPFSVNGSHFWMYTIFMHINRRMQAQRQVHGQLLQKGVQHL